MLNPESEISNPHRAQPVKHRGPSFEVAQAAVVMLHGRGASAESILTLTDAIGEPDIIYLAPEAAGNTWYPKPFLRPVEENEPWLSSALLKVDEVVSGIAGYGIPHKRIVLLGFSQGACLSMEYAARKPLRYGGLIALSGGLIGAEKDLTGYSGDLEKTPVFLGCSDIDSHIPVERVHRSAEIMERLGGVVAKRIYPGMGHTINDDEIAHIKRILASILRPGS